MQATPSASIPGSSSISVQATGKGKGGGKGKASDSSVCQLVDGLKQDVNSLDCGPMMVMSIWHRCTGSEIVQISGTEARARQLLALTECDIYWLDGKKKDPGYIIKRAEKLWKPPDEARTNAESPFRVDSIRWKDVWSMQPDTRYHEEVVDECMLLIQKQVPWTKTLILPVTFMDQLRNDVRASDSEYARARKCSTQIQSGNIVDVEKLCVIVPCQFNDHYFCMTTMLDRGILSGPMLVQDSYNTACVDDHVDSCCSLHNFYLFLYQQNSRIKEIFNDQGHVKHAHSFDIPQFIIDRLGKPHRSISTLPVSSYTAVEFHEMLKDAAVRNRMPNVDGSKARLNVITTLHVQGGPLNKDLMGLLLVVLQSIARHGKLKLPNGDRTHVPGEQEYKRIWDCYRSIMGPGSHAYGGEMELHTLGRWLEAPIVVLRFDPVGVNGRTSLVLHNMVGADQPGLPVFLILSNPCSLAAHYSLAVPSNVEQYARELKATEHLVYVHPATAVVQMGQDPWVFSLFGIPGDGDCLFTSTTLVEMSRDRHLQEGGKNFVPMTRIKLLSSDMKERMKLLASFGPNRGQARVMRLLSVTDDGGHAYDENTVGSVIKKAAIAKDLGVGLDRPWSVIADLGAGAGAALWPQNIAVAKGVLCIGVEENPEQHARLLQVHKHLLVNGWEGKVSTRCISAEDLRSYEGITHVELYDGNPTTVQDCLDQGHMKLMGRLMATSTVDVISTTKFHPRNAGLYAEQNKDVEEYISRFEVIALHNCPFASSKMYSYMWVKKPKFRLKDTEREELFRRHISGHCPTGAVPQLIKAASAGTPLMDDFGRFQRIDVSLENHLNPPEYACSKCTTDGITRNMVLGACYYLPLMGLNLFPGDEITFRSTNVGGVCSQLLNGIFAGVATKAQPTCEDHLLIETSTPPRLLVVPTDYVQEHRPLKKQRTLEETAVIVKQWFKRLETQEIEVWPADPGSHPDSERKSAPPQPVVQHEVVETPGRLLRPRVTKTPDMPLQPNFETPETPEEIEKQLKKEQAAVGKKKQELSRIQARLANLQGSVKQKHKTLQQKEAELVGLRSDSKKTQREILRMSRRQAAALSASESLSSSPSPAGKNSSSKNSSSKNSTNSPDTAGRSGKEVNALVVSNHKLEVKNAELEQVILMEKALRASDKNVGRQEALSERYKNMVESLEKEIRDSKNSADDVATAKVERATAVLTQQLGVMQKEQGDIKNIINKNQLQDLSEKLSSQTKTQQLEHEKNWSNWKGSLSSDFTQMQTWWMEKMIEQSRSRERKDRSRRSISRDRSRSRDKSRRKHRKMVRSRSSGRCKDRSRRSCSRDRSRSRDKSRRNKRSRTDRGTSRSADRSRSKDRKHRRTGRSRSRERKHRKMGRSRSSGRCKDRSRRSSSRDRSRSQDKSRRNKRSRTDRGTSRSADRSRSKDRKHRKMGSSSRDRSRSREPKKNREGSRSRDRDRREPKKSRERSISTAPVPNVAPVPNAATVLNTAPAPNAAADKEHYGSASAQGTQPGYYNYVNPNIGYNYNALQPGYGQRWHMPSYNYY